MVKGTSQTKIPTKLPLGLSNLQTERIWGAMMNLEGAKKLDPPHLTPLKKGGGVMGVVCFGRFFFFLAKVPVPSTSWEVGNLKVEKREDEGRMCWAYVVPSGQLVEATRIVSLIHWVEESRQFSESRSWKTPTFA